MRRPPRHRPLCRRVIPNILRLKINAALTPATVPSVLHATSSKLVVRVESKSCSISIDAESPMPNTMVASAAAARGNRRVRTRTAVRPRGK